jgi:hypothetical protein
MNINEMIEGETDPEKRKVYFTLLGQFDVELLNADYVQKRTGLGASNARYIFNVAWKVYYRGPDYLEDDVDNWEIKDEFDIAVQTAVEDFMQPSLEELDEPEEEEEEEEVKLSHPDSDEFFSFN